MGPGRDATLTLTTLSECANTAIKNGYSQNFRVTKNTLVTDDGKSFYKPTDIIISNFYRFEGYTDPQDSAILFLIETTDGKKGTLINAYGVYADSEYSDFIRQVENIHKS